MACLVHSFLPLDTERPELSARSPPHTLSVGKDRGPKVAEVAVTSFSLEWPDPGRQASETEPHLSPSGDRSPLGAHPP